MSPDDARDFSASDLLRVLNEKLSLERTRLKRTPSLADFLLPPVSRIRSEGTSVDFHLKSRGDRV